MLHCNRFDFEGADGSDPCGELELEAEIELLHRRYLLATTTVNERPARSDFNVAMHRLPESRRQLIFRIRRQIAEGAYDTPERWDAALERLFEVVAADSGQRE